MNEVEIEKEIESKNLKKPRVTPRRIDDCIMKEDYYVFPNTALTICCLTLRNGFNVLGESACASTENFDAELGRKIAKGHARDKIWELEGYLLKEKINNGETTFG